MDNKIGQYLEQLLPNKHPWIEELEGQAKKDHIPIMESTSIHFMLHLLKIIKPYNILEVGTAIGYSALRMNDVCPESKIITIEKDEIRYREAVRNILLRGKQVNIQVLLGDALEKMETLKAQEKRFDFIFIDAAKGKYKQFFERAIPLLTDKGVIFTDNVLFRGLVAIETDQVPKRYRNMVVKIKEYNEYLMNHPSFDTTILPVGDGIAISNRKGNN